MLHCLTLTLFFLQVKKYSFSHTLSIQQHRICKTLHLLLHVIRFKITTHIQNLSRREVTESPLILHTLLGQYRILEVLDSTLGPKISYPELSL